MTSKKQGLYKEVINYVFDKVEIITGKQPEPELVISDFELAILSMLGSKFPNQRMLVPLCTGNGLFETIDISPSSHTVYCRLFFGTLVKKLGLKKEIKEREDVRRVLHLLIAVALLPPQQANGTMKVNFCPFF
jgi:hypothetical protein